MKYQLSWIALTFLILQNSANATTGLCDEQAPLLDSGYYYDINDPKQIPDEQLRLLRQFAKALDGRWLGEETIATCQGHFSNPKAVKYEYLVDAEISTSSNGVVRLKTEKEPADKSVSRLQTLWITPETEALLNRQRWHTLELVNRNTLVYSHKYRARNSQRTTRLIHEVNRVSVQGGQLVIDRKLYVNGAIAEQSGISLKRAS